MEDGGHHESISAGSPSRVLLCPGVTAVYHQGNEWTLNSLFFLLGINSHRKPGLMSLFQSQSYLLIKEDRWAVCFSIFLTPTLVLSFG